jgi:hypothetical protein
MGHHVGPLWALEGADSDPAGPTQLPKGAAAGVAKHGT